MWGPGDGPAGVDELLAQFEGTPPGVTDPAAALAIQSTPWWVLQDAGGDVVGLVETPAPIGGATRPARLVGQWTYDAYGTVLSADGLYPVDPHPALHCGHKGLFFDNLEDGITDSSGPGAAALPRLMPVANGVYHVRNRAYMPRHGRWLQSDPNATGMVAAGDGGPSRAPTARGAGALNLGTMFGDGPGLYQYLGGNPWQRFDPAGLSYDPFEMVDEFLAETTADRAAFLAQIGQDMHAAAVVAATVASYLPFPAASFAGELALAALNGEDLSDAMMTASIGLVPGGRLMSGVGSMAGRVGVAAINRAGSYAAQHGAGLASRLGGGSLINLVGRSANAVKQKFPQYFSKGRRNHTVYIGFMSGTAMYVGITDDVDRREAQHKRTFGPGFKASPIVKGLTEFEARSIESLLIMANPHFDNKRLSMAQKWPFFDKAMIWAAQELRSRGIQFVW